MREQKEQRRAEAEARKAVARAQRDHQRKIEEIEMQIATLEGKQRDLTAELEKPETYAAGGAATRLNRDLMAVADDLARLNAAWEALSARAP
jgi:hypothetical protein